MTFFSVLHKMWPILTPHKIQIIKKPMIWPLTLNSSLPHNLLIMGDCFVHCTNKSSVSW